MKEKPNLPFTECLLYPAKHQALSMYYDPHVMDEEMEAQASYRNYPQPHN